MKGIFALAALFVVTAAAAQNQPPQYVQPAPLAQHDQSGASQLEKAAASRNICDNNVGAVATIFDGINVNFTPTVLKAILHQFPLAFMIPMTQLEDKAVIAHVNAGLAYKHQYGIRFSSYFDNALASLTPEIVNNLLATAEQQYKKAFNLNLQYVMFADKTPDFVLNVARARQLRPILYNVDFSTAGNDHIGKLEQILVDPGAQSYVGLLNAHNSGQTQVLLDIYNAADIIGFKAVHLSECLLPLRKATDSDLNHLVNPNNPNAQPQAIVAAPDGSAAAFFGASSSLMTALLAIIALIVV